MLLTAFSDYLPNPFSVRSFQFLFFTGLLKSDKQYIHSVYSYFAITDKITSRTYETIYHVYLLLFNIVIFLTLTLLYVTFINWHQDIYIRVQEVKKYTQYII